jgi:hypothetical protein
LYYYYYYYDYDYYDYYYSDYYYYYYDYYYFDYYCDGVWKYYRIGDRTFPMRPGMVVLYRDQELSWFLVLLLT